MFVLVIELQPTGIDFNASIGCGWDPINLVTLLLSVRTYFVRWLIKSYLVQYTLFRLVQLYNMSLFTYMLLRMHMCEYVYVCVKTGIDIFYHVFITWSYQLWILQEASSLVVGKCPDEKCSNSCLVLRCNIFHNNYHYLEVTLSKSISNMSVIVSHYSTYSACVYSKDGLIICSFHNHLN